MIADPTLADVLLWFSLSILAAAVTTVLGTRK
jgi:hypothetical protein